MRVLVVDRKELYRCEGNARIVVVLYNWGYGVIIGQGMYEYCNNLGNLLTDPNVSERRLRAVRQWLEKHPDKIGGARSG
jgi:hypothetical protein